MHGQLNILLLIGIAVFMGLSGGKIFQKIKIPQVVGYIIIGLLLGDSFLGLLKFDIIEILTPVTSFALGLIGFMIGGELKKDVFIKYGKKFTVILLWEGVLTFVLVTAAVTWFSGKFHIGILLGALASATAPAATVDVLWENKSKGVLTSAILAIVALDDGLALMLYGFSSAFAKTLITGESFSFFSGFILPLKEIGSAILLGAAIGYVVYRMLLKINEREQLLTLSIGAILVTTGLSIVFDFDLILANMTMGVILANQSSQISKSVFDIVKSFTPPVYILFFVLVGARVQVSLLPKMGLLGLIYLITRSIGKLSGSYLGGYFSKAERVIMNYLGLTLFSQAGVAIGLSIAIYQSFSKLGPAGEEAGLLIMNVIAATTFIVQLLGPPCVKLGIKKAGEIGKDITEEDILNTYTVKQVMEKEVETIHANEKLSNVVQIVKDSSHIYFPVIDKQNNNKFLGVISFQDIKDVIYERGLGELVLASEVVIYDIVTSYMDDPVKSAMDKFLFVNLNYLPVIESENSDRFVGILHKRNVAKILKEEVIGKLVGLKKGNLSKKSRKISELLEVNNINLDIKGENKKDIINEMTSLLGQSNSVKDKQGLIDDLLEREAQTTTGIGDGIAIPHIRTSKVSDIILGFGRSQSGAEFMAIDRMPVYLIFMIAVPIEKGESLIKIMGELSRLLRDEELRNFLKETDKKQDVIDMFIRKS